MDLTDIKDLSVKAKANAIVSEQKLSAMDATLDAASNELERLPALTRTGQRVTCSVISRQLHETRDTIHKLRQDMENMQSQLQRILAEVDAIDNVTNILRKAK